MTFLRYIGDWVNRHFASVEAVYLVFALVIAVVVLYTIGIYLAPILTGLIFAFIFHTTIERFAAWGVPEILSVSVAVLIVVGVLLALLIGILPLVWNQLNQSVAALPDLMDKIQVSFANLSEAYPDLFKDATLTEILRSFRDELTGLGPVVAQRVLGQVPNVLAIVIYLVLVPVSMFFFLKDRERLLDWFKQTLLPKERPILDEVGSQMSMQIIRYVRGKFVEICIVGGVTFIGFSLLGLNFAVLLSLLVGLSVLIPFIGAAVVTLPIIAVASLQFGFSLEFVYVLVFYAVVQLLDGNFLVPVLFSEVVDLHPITIIIAVLAFGGLWGVWGVFFAIPLAVLIKSVYNAWPKAEPASG